MLFYRYKEIKAVHIIGMNAEIPGVEGGDRKWKCKYILTVKDRREN